MRKRIGISTFILGTLLVFFMSICVSSQVAYAHPPQDVQLAYDVKAQTLTVIIIHKSTFGFHYINSVVVKKNGIVVSTNNYDKQPDPATFTYTYNIAAGKGDTLEVTANCSLSGSKAATLDIK